MVVENLQDSVTYKVQGSCNIKYEQAQGGPGDMWHCFLINSACVHQCNEFSVCGDEDYQTPTAYVRTTFLCLCQTLAHSIN